MVVMHLVENDDDDHHHYILTAAISVYSAEY